MATTTRRVCCTFALALALAAGAAAQPATPPPATVFAVLSLVGDQFTVVSRKDEVGSRLYQNTRRSYPIDTPVLDEYALDAAERTIGRLKPGVAITVPAAQPDEGGTFQTSRVNIGRGDYTP